MQVFIQDFVLGEVKERCVGGGSGTTDVYWNNLIEVIVQYEHNINHIGSYLTVVYRFDKNIF